MQVEEIVAGIVGSGRARVQVAAELDLNRIESRSETFDPESRVVRSTQTRAENQMTTGSGRRGQRRQRASGRQPAAGNAAGPRDASNKNEETINYEISRTTRTEILEGGRMKRLSVAVLVDGIYAKGANGEVDLPAPPAGGTRPDRRPRPHGDRLRPESRRPGRGREPALRRQRRKPWSCKEEGLVASLLNPSKEDVLRLIEIAVIALLTLIVLMTVVRPLVLKVIGPETSRRSSLVAQRWPARRRRRRSPAVRSARKPGRADDRAREGERTGAAAIAGAHRRTRQEAIPPRASRCCANGSTSGR